MNKLRFLYLFSTLTVLLCSCVRFSAFAVDLETVFEAPESEIITAFEWSYDSNRLAINTFKPDGAESTIFILSLDTGTYERINTGSFDSENEKTYEFAAWLPGSEIIALSSPNMDTFRLYDLERLTPLGEIDYPGQISWSPDNNYIAFVNRSNHFPNYRLEIGIANLHTGATQGYIVPTITDYAPYADYLAWSPDSLSLAFYVDNKLGDGKSDIYLIQIEKGSITSITSSGNNTSPTWLSNDNIILLSRRAIGLIQTMEVLNIRTGCQVSISVSAGLDSISISPDRTQIAILEDRSIFVSTTEKLLDYIETKCK